MIDSPDDPTPELLAIALIECCVRDQYGAMENLIAGTDLAELRKVAERLVIVAAMEILEYRGQRDAEHLLAAMRSQILDRSSS